MKIRGTDFVLYNVSDLHAAVIFYRDVLGLPLELCSDEWQWAEFNCGNVTLALHGGMEVEPGSTRRAFRSQWTMSPRLMPSSRPRG
jgi:catechol 2,3-dioxygenase-like lactoylglutathione lyase family enzyme